MNRVIQVRSRGALRTGTALAIGAILTAGSALSPALAAATPPTTATSSSSAPAQPPPSQAAPAEKGGGMSPMNMVGDKLDGVLTKIGATDDQKTKIKSVMITAFGQLMGMAPEVKQVPKAFEAALTGPTVDRALLEKTRVQLIANLDQGSKILTQALADAADALTPDQRAKLAAMLAPKPKPKS